MTPSMLRQFWGVVSSLNLRGLPTDADDELVRLLLKTCRNQPAFDSLDSTALSSYIMTRLQLIREVAAS